jgi:hypothetical protein
MPEGSTQFSIAAQSCCYPATTCTACWNAEMLWPRSDFHVRWTRQMLCMSPLSSTVQFVNQNAKNGKTKEGKDIDLNKPSLVNVNVNIVCKTRHALEKQVSFRGKQIWGSCHTETLEREKLSPWTNNWKKPVGIHILDLPFAWHLECLGTGA